MIAAVVCVDQNWGIGKDNDLLVHIPEDMKMFKRITTNEVPNTSFVVMGRKTYDSLPKKPLPNRVNIVITSSVEDIEEIEENVFFVSMEYAVEFLTNDHVVSRNKGIYIIGGGMIYKTLLPLCEKVFVTKVHNTYEADTFFPNIDDMNEWKLESESEIKEHNGINYQFCVYKNMLE